MYVAGQAGLVDVRLSGLDGLDQGVVDKDVLLLRLHQMVALTPHVLQVAEDVDVTPGFHLPQDGVQHDVASGAADASTRNARYLNTGIAPSKTFYCVKHCRKPCLVLFV